MNLWREGSSTPTNMKSTNRKRPTIRNKPTELEVKHHVREIVLDVAKPLTVNGIDIVNARQVDPAWMLGLPFPIGMDKSKINGQLVPELDLYVKTIKPTASFTPADIKPNMTVGDLQDSVWAKVK
jgi:hypothetical protein